MVLIEAEVRLGQGQEPPLRCDVAEDAGWKRRGGLRELLRQRWASARGRRATANSGSGALEIRRFELPLRHEELVVLARRHGVTTLDEVVRETKQWTPT